MGAVGEEAAAAADRVALVPALDVGDAVHWEAGELLGDDEFAGAVGLAGGVKGAVGASLETGAGNE